MLRPLRNFSSIGARLSLEADSALGETHTDPEEAEIAAKAADILFKSLADSISAAMSTSELGIFRNYDDEEHELTSPWIDIVDEQPKPALTTYGTHMEPEPVVDITEEQQR